MPIQMVLGLFNFQGNIFLIFILIFKGGKKMDPYNNLRGLLDFLKRNRKSILAGGIMTSLLALISWLIYVYTGKNIPVKTPTPKETEELIKKIQELLEKKRPPFPKPPFK